MRKVSLYNDIKQLKGLLDLCLKGNDEAIMQFQDIFGEDIYNFPIKTRGADMNNAADFYCYCFEKGRIFKRLLTYKGKCALRTYQYYILNNLYSEWRRTQKVLYSESIDSPLTCESETSWANVLEDENAYISLENDAVLLKKFNHVIDKLSEEERLYIKLLTYHELGFDISDLRALSKISKKPLNEVMDLINEVDRRLSEKDEEYARKASKLDEIDVRILNIEKRLKTLREKQDETLAGEIDELERKLQWRYRQKGKLIALFKKIKGGLTYREMAMLLSVSPGTVSTKINNAKKRFLEIYGVTNEEKNQRLS